MDLRLLSCDAQRPDRRAIIQYLTEYASGMNASLAQELTSILLDGDEVEISILDKHTASALRALRKLDIDYQIVE